MANVKEHAWIGAAAGALTYTATCRYFDRPFDFGEMLGCIAVGTAGALLPDLIEPAITPNHRGFAHSVAVGAALIRFATDRCGAQNRAWDEFRKMLCASATAGYLSHLVADGCTARSLPLLA